MEEKHVKYLLWASLIAVLFYFFYYKPKGLQWFPRSGRGGKPESVTTALTDSNQGGTSSGASN